MNLEGSLTVLPDRVIVAIDILTGVDLRLCRATAPDISTSVSVRSSSDGVVHANSEALGSSVPSKLRRFLRYSQRSVSTL